MKPICVFVRVHATALSVQKTCLSIVKHVIKTSAFKKVLQTKNQVFVLIRLIHLELCVQKSDYTPDAIQIQQTKRSTHPKAHRYKVMFLFMCVKAKILEMSIN